MNLNYILMVSWGSKVGTSFPCWYLLARVGHGTSYTMWTTHDNQWRWYLEIDKLTNWVTPFNWNVSQFLMIVHMFGICKPHSNLPCSGKEPMATTHNNSCSVVWCKDYGLGAMLNKVCGCFLGLFFKMPNFYLLDSHNETCVVIENLQWKITKK